MARYGEIDWLQARAALDQASGRVATLLRSVREPQAVAVGDWTIAELAAHLSHAFDIVPGLARPGGRSPLGHLSDLSALTASLVADDAERDLAVLADRIEEGARMFLQVTASASDADPCPWIVEGSSASLPVLTCHLLNEVVVHGYDIARADDQPWVIDREVAALIFEGFLLHAFRVLDPATLVDQEKAAGVKARFDIRLRGAGRFCLVLDGGGMTVEAPSSARVDCHLSVDPTAFLLVAWGRISQWRAIPRGQLLAWGRRPWLGLRLRSLVRNP